MIKYIKGNLFERPAPDDDTIRYICHVANDMRVMGSGFALELVKKYPLVKECNVSEYLGELEFINVAKHLVVCNMVAQHQTIRQNGKPIRYSALVQCMEKVKAAVSHARTAGFNVEIVGPKFGSDRARGNWDFIEELINEIWAEIPTFIYVLEGK